MLIYAPIQYLVLRSLLYSFNAVHDIDFGFLCLSLELKFSD